MYNRKEDINQDKSDQVEILSSDIEQFSDKPFTSQNSQLKIKHEI